MPFVAIRLPVRIAAAGLLFLACLFALPAQAQCLQAGGKLFCGTRHPTDWNPAGLCQETAATTIRDSQWCVASGGTWDGQCHGAAPHTDDNMVQHAVRFAELIRPAGTVCNLTGDTGWGASYPALHCNRGADFYEEGHVTGTFRRLSIFCSTGSGELISANKSRGLACPAGYTPATNPVNGAPLCARALEDCDGCKVIGNPITPATGTKVQAEVDYRHALGLQFSRHYHSFRFYEPATNLAGAHGENRLGLAWRSNFDKRVVPITPASSFISKALTLPSGEVQYFDSTGKEIYNYRGAGGSLVTAANGFFYKGPDSTEFYGTDGRLKSISLASGPMFTLTYSDGTTGPNGGFILDAAGNPTTSTLPANSLIRVADGYGNTLAFGYDIQARMVLMTDAGGGRHLYAYDADSNLISATFPDARTRTYRYNEPANMVGGASIKYALTSILDENNDVFASFKYDTSARAVSTEHAGGTQRYELTYNAGNTSVSDPLATVRTFGFAAVDGISRYTGASQPGGAGYGAGVKSRTQDTKGNVTSQTDFNDIKTCSAFDTLRNLETVRVEGVPAATSCSSVTGGGAALPAGSRKITTEWHARWRLPLRLSEPQRRTTFAYNGEGGGSCAPVDALIEEGGASPAPIAVLCSRSLQATSDADGGQGMSASPVGLPREWSYTYNATGQVLGVDGPRTDVSDAVTSVYTPQGNLSSVTNAASHVTSITSHNLHGQPLTVVDANGITTTLTYDERQRVKTRSTGGELTAYDYDGVGQLTKVTLPDGSFLSYSYDAAHRLTGMQDNAGNRVAYTLDAMDNRTLEQVFDPVNALAQTRSRVYSNLNRLFQELGAQSQTTEYGYDSQGNVTSVKDPLNRITSNQYDALNRLRQVTDPALGVTQYAYNGLDALTQVTDPRNLVTGYTVDGLGNLTLQASPDTGNTTNTHDAAGNLLSQTDAKGQGTTYAYDALNRVTLITFHDGSKQAYAYDQGTNGIGRLSSIPETDPTNQQTSLTQYAYSSHGRVTSETRTVNGVQYVVGYGYDATGRLSGITYPSGRTLAYSFDSLGRVSGVSTTFNGQTQPVVSSVAYHPFGGVKSYALGNGQAYARGYDQDGRISSYTLGAKSFSIGYDVASRIEFINEFGVPANTNSYGYDSLDRLTSAVIPGTPYGYSYDAVGNRLSKTAGAATDTLTYGATSNRIATLTPALGPQRTFVFDPNGSTTDDGINTFAYDVRGRMVQATSVIGTTGYQVNALGQRIRKTNSQGDTVFHYDTRGRLIAETSPAGALKREILYLGDIPVGVVQ